MKKKNKLNIKVKNSLRTEQIIIRVLIGVSITALLISVFIEFLAFSPDCTTHWDFLKNILLGVSGSSIISYLCLLFPYLKNRDKQINSIINLLKEFYIYYLEKHYYFFRISNGENPSDDYIVDMEIYENVDKLEDRAKYVVNEYRNSDFSSGKIDNIVNMLEKDMPYFLTAIKNAYSFILPEDIKKSNFEELLKKKKDYQYKLKQQSYFKVLLDTLDNILSEKDMEDLYSGIIVSNFDECNNNLINKINDIAKSLIDNNNISNNVRFLMLMNSSLIKASMEWDSFNTNKSEQYEDALNLILNQNDFNIKDFEDIITEINQAQGELDFEKVEQKINELKSSINIEK